MVCGEQKGMITDTIRNTNGVRVSAAGVGSVSVSVTGVVLMLVSVVGCAGIMKATARIETDNAEPKALMATFPAVKVDGMS